MAIFLSYFLNQAYPLVFLVFLNRKYPADEIGNLIVAQAFLTLIYAVVDYSSSISIAKSDKSIDFYVTYFFSRFFILVPVAVAIFTVYGVLSGISALDIFLIAMSVVIYGFNVPYVYQFSGKMMLYTILNLFGKVLSISMIAIWENGDILALFGTSQLLVSAPFLLYGYYYTLKVRDIKLDSRSRLYGEALKMLKQDYGVFTSSLISISLSSGLIIASGYFFSSSALAAIGIYDRLGKGINSLFFPISNLFLEIRDRLSNRDMTLLYISILACAFVTFILFGRTAICKLFGCDLLENISILYIYFIWVLFGLFNNVLGIQNLLLKGFSKEYSFKFLLASAVSIPSLFAFSRLGVEQLSLALSLLVSECVLFIFLLRSFIDKRKGGAL